MNAGDLEGTDHDESDQNDYEIVFDNILVVSGLSPKTTEGFGGATENEQY